VLVQHLQAADVLGRAAEHGHRADDVVQVAGGHGRPRLRAACPLDRVDHILGRNRAAAVEGGLGPQMEGISAPIIAQVPTLSQVGRHLELWVERHQPAKEVHDILGRSAILHQRWI